MPASDQNPPTASLRCRSIVLDGYLLRPSAENADAALAAIFNVALAIERGGSPALERILPSRGLAAAALLLKVEGAGRIRV